MFISITFTILMFYILIVPKGQLTIKTYEYMSKEKMTFANKVYCYVPLYNTFIIRKYLYGGGMTSLIVTYTFSSIFMLNLIIRFFLQDFAFLQTVSTVFIVGAILLAYITEVVLMVQMVSLFSGGWKYATVIVPAVTASILTPLVKKRLKESKHKLEGTFDGRKKGRPNPDRVQTR